MGRDWDGVDCWGLRCLIFRHELGIELPSYSDKYTTASDTRVIMALINDNLNEWEQVEYDLKAARGKERQFDGVLMREGAFPRHIGTVIRPGLLIHIEVGRTSKAQSYRDGDLRQRVLGIYRQR